MHSNAGHYALASYDEKCRRPPERCSPSNCASLRMTALSRAKPQRKDGNALSIRSPRMDELLSLCSHSWQSGAKTTRKQKKPSTCEPQAKFRIWKSKCKRTQRLHPIEALRTPSGPPTRKPCLASSNRRATTLGQQASEFNRLPRQNSKHAQNHAIRAR